MKIKKLILLFSILLMVKSYAQGSSAVPFLSLQQSPFLQGAGATGVAVITEDPLGFYYNPAILGVTAKTNHISTLFLTKKTEWIGIPDFNTNSYGLNIGYNLEGKLPISLGFGFIHNEINYNYYGNNENSFSCFSLGAGFNYPVIFSLGFSVKKFSSILTSYPIANPSQIYKLSSTAYDLGALLDIPVSTLFLDNVSFKLDEASSITPNLNFIIGYSITNLGKEVYYVDKSQMDPIPRTAKLGYSLNLGADFHISDKTIAAFEYTFVAEASDLLPELDSNFNTSYKGPLGDINIGRNLIQLKYSSNTIIHKAHIFNIFETVKLAFGNFVGSGYEYNPKTSAIVISTEGIFKLLNNQAGNSVLGFITYHFGIEYTASKIFKDTSLETKYSAISIFFNNFEL
ncbi:MAG: hypothetical protein WB779_16580 [Ignavibacteriaceae bacterium]